MTAMARSDYGVMTDRAEPWEYRAACRETPHLHLADPTSGPIGTQSAQARAIHVCGHCPVMRQCAQQVERLGNPASLTQAGHAYDQRGRPFANVPDPGHGPWCAHLRYTVPAWRRKAAVA
jgi:hypothetical protein